VKRRKFLQAASHLTLGAGLTKILAAQEPPAIIRRDGARPTALRGAACGDVQHDRAIIWSAADRPCRMIVEWAPSNRFNDANFVPGPSVTEATDFTGKIDLRDLPPGERIYYRVQFQDLRDLKVWSEPVIGTFLTPPRPDGAARDVKIAFTGDVCGQGWGIDHSRGGLKMFETMRAAEPDYFVHLGDTIYADNPIPAEVKLEDGSLWRNETTQSKAHVAQTLDDFRGCYRYNLLDENVRRFNAATTVNVITTSSIHELILPWCTGFQPCTWLG